MEVEVNSKTTWLLAAATLVIFTVIGVGFITAAPRQQPPQAKHTTVPKSNPLPNKQELEQKLTIEQPMIHAVLASSFPTITNLYTIEREALYDQGEWYGAILQYKGGDVNSRDTLRVVLQKKNSVWVVRTTPPQILVDKYDLSDAPTAMLDDINRPATLVGAGDSPTITPNE